MRESARVGCSQGNGWKVRVLGCWSVGVLEADGCKVGFASRAVAGMRWKGSQGLQLREID